MDILHTRRDLRRSRRRTRLLAAGAIAAVSAVASILVPVVLASPASAVTNIVVDSLEWGGEDAAPGDGACATADTLLADPECTLRAAIEESNALALGAGEVLITVDESIPVGSRLGDIPNVNADKMITTRITAQDAYGAYFHVTSPVTIDLGHRIQVNGSVTLLGAGSDSYEAAAFYLDGPDITVQNADMVLSPGSSFVIGPDAERVVIDGDTGGGKGVVATTANYSPERFVVFREGVSDVTVRDYEVSGYYDSTVDGGIFVFDSYDPDQAMRDIVIEHVDVLYSSGTTCSASNGSGCRTRLTNFWRDTAGPTWTDNTIDGLTFRHMRVENMTGQYAFQLGSPGNLTGSNSADITDLVIEDNVFTDNQGYGTGRDYAFITLPYGDRLHGTSTIARNTFVRAESGNTFAIARYGAESASSVVPSGLTVADNHFDGYSDVTIRLQKTGLVTVEGNTFGTRTASQAAPGTAEETSDTRVMLDNYDDSANEAVQTWTPSGAAAVPQGAIPQGALRVEPPASTLPVCTAVVDATEPAPSGETTAAAEPVTLQLYWTAGDTAEVHLGEVRDVPGGSAKLAFSLPVGAVTLPNGTAQAVDPVTGVVSGFVRLQTQVEGLGQLESSQYSRVVPVTGNCRPALTLNQADGQHDPTLGRDLHFTLTSSIPLDAATVTPAAFQATASATADTIDASRLDVRVVRVDPVAGSDGMSFDVVVRVDDSADVTIALAADRVASPSGLTNKDAASSTDARIAFVNPLQVDPAAFDLVAGEPHGRTFTLRLRAGAPEPTADLAFATVIAQPEGTPELHTSADPVIAAHADESDVVTVTADAGSVTAGTHVTISFTVASDDANYDGLVVPRVTPKLYATDPAIQIVKSAYVDVTDVSTPEAIEATGTLAPTGGRLLDGQLVYFVYTVTNLSQDDWETTLTDITVTDSDERLGEDGVIGTIPQLRRGESLKLSASGALIPEDTTQAAPAPAGE
ncbi:right-handed parallel beta-helix repeat-containing protein [Microbacterium rhizophilus]|uniref:right-handed parallel beta-helix repeat-containing protein n=1 Tax=Microbacterium rhizophilus TaxID=3138934 RepID=UPI0031ED1708